MSSWGPNGGCPAADDEEDSVDRSAPHNPHETRVAFLHTLATLAGCHTVYGSALPDGRRPDVLRLNRWRNILFIGDGKDSESPRCNATLARLAGYFLWLRVHVRNRGGAAMFAICFGNRRHREAWLSTLTRLAADAGVPVRDGALTSFGMGLFVAWVVIEATGQSRRRSDGCGRRHKAALAGTRYISAVPGGRPCGRAQSR